MGRISTTSLRRKSGQIGHPAFGAGVAKLSVVAELIPGSVGGVLTVNPKFARSGAKQ
jgi:hypothetical protein